MTNRPLTADEVKRMFEAMDKAASDKQGRMWAEYDSAAEWCAKRGLKGNEGDRLPTGLSDAVLSEINDHPEAFAERIRATAYALAMEKHN